MRRLLPAVVMLGAFGCSRTALIPECPNGYTFDEKRARCVCATDEGCPMGYSCELQLALLLDDGGIAEIDSPVADGGAALDAGPSDGGDADAGAVADAGPSADAGTGGDLDAGIDGGVLVPMCVCRDTSCCPAGYQYSNDAQNCICHDQRCCPDDHIWLADAGMCTCNGQNCCPLQGYTFNSNPDAGACECTSDLCCPNGFTLADKDLCKCASDGCCPIDHSYDPITGNCVCATDDCCPMNYKYSAAVRACVCVGDTCCPTGYKKDPMGERCICIDDASCGTGNVCDAASGSCRCTSNAGCKPGNFCNALGYCQSIAACTSNVDCPSGLFCDTTTNKCIVNGPCTLDSQCPEGQICNAATASCKPGCRTTADCPFKKSCQNHQCVDFCLDNDYCPVNQFCDTSSGSCSTHSGRSDCDDCSTGICGGAGHCLEFISEGQTNSFCGEDCMTDAECPSGFDCGPVIFSCDGALSVCPDVPGTTITCKGFMVENEMGEKFYCTDSTGQPHEYFKACAPQSGNCPATGSP
jgi:Cys-rich repeat protein